MLPNSKIKAIGLLVAVAFTGFAAGAATMTRADTTAAAAPTDWRERCRYSGMLKDQLNLTDAQSDSIRAIMRAHRGEMDGVMQRVRPQMDSLQAIVRAEIRAVLTAEQAAQYDSLRARERAERQARERGDSSGRGATERR